ncbi:MAG: hypothetical protein HYY33_01200 [Chloroflexi bacterium]|nr:hypothetical protein [Chloroflexota bacterium]
MTPSILAYQPIDRIRRNHGLEHATIHVLAAGKRRTMAGYSDTGGFYLLGDLTAEEIGAGVNEALQRMRGGEHDLAVHPECGTNYVTAGAFAALAGFVALIGARGFRAKLERFPLMFALVTAALLAAQPVGLSLQANVTTSGLMGHMEVASIMKINDHPVLHRVETRG